MKTINNLSTVVGTFLVLVLSAQTSLAQSYNINNSASKLLIEGTSNIHAWELVAESLQGNLNAELKNGQLVKINHLNFGVVSESLKSGKGGMDKNTFKALKTDKNQRITYQLQKVNNIECVSANECRVVTSGYLTIAGTKKLIDLTFDAQVTGNKIALAGNKKIKMTEFNVDPPTAMFGTITTGDEVNVKFQTVYTN